MAWPTSRYKTAAAGGSWVPNDMNGVQDQYIDGTGIHVDGATIIDTQETQTAATYGKLTTPDEVTGVVLPTDGFLCVLFHCSMMENVRGTAYCGMFVGSDQVKMFKSGQNVVETQIDSFTGNLQVPVPVVTHGGGLWAGDTSSGNGTFPTTPYLLGAGAGSGIATDGSGRGGPCWIWAPAGTYDVSMQFKAAAGGTVTVENRKLWVWTATP